MKTKKILSLLLALALCIALACPALAAYEDTEPPMWQQWGYGSLEELLADWEMTEEEYYEMIEWDVAEQKEWPAWREAYLAAHPDFAETAMAKDAEDPVWAVFGDESLEEFMAWYAEEGQTYADVVVDWYLMDIFWDEWYAAAVLREREAMGGPAEGVGVMWMDKYVQFPDVQPEITNDRTMIPIRAFMEFTGAVVDYADGTVFLTLPDGAEISFVIGETTAVLKRGEESRTITMDTATYLKEDRTYVPLRFFSEALGYDVRWDEIYRTAVVIDAESLIRSADENFTIFNGALRRQNVYDADKTYRSDLDLTGNIRLYDYMIGGWQSAKLSMNLSALSRGKTVDGSVKWDAGDFLSLLVGEDGETLTAEDAAVLDALSKSDAQLLFNGETGELYLQSPVIGQLMGLLGDAPVQLPASAWLKLTLDLTELAALTETGAAELPESMTCGSVLYMLASAEDSISICDQFRVLTDAAVEQFGDACFTRTYNGYKTAYSNTDPELGLSQELRMTVCDDGAVSMDFTLKADGISLTLNVSGGNASVSLKMEDMVELSIKLSSSVRETREMPRTAPGADAMVFDLGTLDLEGLLAETIGDAGLEGLLP